LREHITFPCGDIQLEGCWHFPEPAGLTPAVVVCHPHPLHGGSMSSNVVFDICEALAQRQVAALRFNFRGVRGSGGTYGDGIAEQEDVRSALAVVSAEPRVEREKIGLAGYSFGAGVAMAVAIQDDAVKVLVLVSPAADESGWEQLKTYSRPLFVISGEHDFLMSPEQARLYIGENTGLRKYEAISGADHFWEGYEAEVAQKVAEFLTTALKTV
jgi:alpha/beta superfamily hydrolase